MGEGLESRRGLRGAWNPDDVCGTRREAPWEFPSPACTGHLPSELPTLTPTPDRLPNSVPGHLAPSPAFLPSGGVSVTCLSLMGWVLGSPLINEPAWRGLQTPPPALRPTLLSLLPPLLGIREALRGPGLRAWIRDRNTWLHSLSQLQPHLPTCFAARRSRGAHGSRHSSWHLQVLCTRRKAKWISPTAAPLGLTFVDLLPLLPYLIINSP